MSSYKIADTGNFKDARYSGASEAIAEYLQHGPHKTGTYYDSQKYCQLSGVHWDNVRGANIEGEAATIVWNEYISRKIALSHKAVAYEGAQSTNLIWLSPLP
ncbi:uncharacterized protein F5147DRAFT_656129 [Suillus discolor]|uniref:Uncharacterized protein n=1 Tax=Suillus discolor TaxID=1912936 RepID=A0A9P7EYD8_9AGAM|nr:uncharacterized protein F5147DRAFT_656129 [Suillus discolor]KAG2098240.1 hypothetical protein F5147DRAFT_656129 [Suillus discolor]